MRVIDELAGQEGVEQRLEGGRRARRVQAQAEEQRRELLVGQGRALAAATQGGEAAGGEATRLDGGQVGAAALDEEDLGRVAQELDDARLDAGVAAAVEHQRPLAAEEARGVDPEGEILAVLRRETVQSPLRLGRVVARFHLGSISRDRIAAGRSSRVYAGDPASLNLGRLGQGWHHRAQRFRQCRQCHGRVSGARGLRPEGGTDAERTVVQANEDARSSRATARRGGPGGARQHPARRDPRRTAAATTRKTTAGAGRAGATPRSAAAKKAAATRRKRAATGVKRPTASRPRTARSAGSAQTATAKRAAPKRATAKRATAKRSTGQAGDRAKRATPKRATAKRTTAKRASAKRATRTGANVASTRRKTPAIAKRAR